MQRLICNQHLIAVLDKVDRSYRQRARSRSKAMVTVKSSQKIFTDSEVASLTGICIDHIHNFAKSRHLGFIARAAEAAESFPSGCSSSVRLSASRAFCDSPTPLNRRAAPPSELRFPECYVFRRFAPCRIFNLPLKSCVAPRKDSFARLIPFHPAIGTFPRR